MHHLTAAPGVHHGFDATLLPLNELVQAPVLPDPDGRFPLLRLAPALEWSKRQGVVELFPCLSSPNRTCASQRIRLSAEVSFQSKATPFRCAASLNCVSLIIEGLHLTAVS
jgi:hypothetical protein